MKYLEALKIGDAPGNEPPLPIRVAMSGTADLLETFIRAHARLTGFDAKVSFLPFNTLGQALHGVAAPGEVVLLTPWDFVPALDWRSGLPEGSQTYDETVAEADQFADRVANRNGARVAYLDAPTPPVLANHPENEQLRRYLSSRAADLGATMLQRSCFSLANYLASGSPFASAKVSEVARTIVEATLPPESQATAKVLVTDLDGTLWHGVVGEDGVDGLHYGPEGLGYKHFLFQTLLVRLKDRGALIGVVSRNDPDLARAPFENGDMPLELEDVIALVASYNAKSSQIRQLAEELNLGLDAFVFVDDNPVEIQEVGTQLPDVDCVTFPEKDADVPRFLDHLAKRFSTSAITNEDRGRTELYRKRLEGITASALEGADLTGFLVSLEMEMNVHEHSAKDASGQRARQLINKTNQFNANGIRWTDQEIDSVLEGGGRLFGATVKDRSGSHGEVISLLVDREGEVRAFVMSCRVFQRRIEYAFLAHLLGKLDSELCLHHVPTDRNAPFKTFVADDAFVTSDRGVRILRDRFLETHGASLGLFRIADDAT